MTGWLAANSTRRRAEVPGGADLIVALHCHLAGRQALHLNSQK